MTMNLPNAPASWPAQAVFDYVALHLLTQGERSDRPGTGDESVCMYRGPKGRACAVGCLIPDALYDTSLEKRSLESLVVSEPRIRNWLGHYYLLNSLQALHDTQTPADWPAGLRHVAFNYDLSPRVIDRFKAEKAMPSTATESPTRDTNNAA